MDNHAHALHLGGLVGNLQTLEMMIRLALSQQEGSSAKGTFGDDFRDAPIGTRIPLSDMSNYASLRQLIEEFNEKLSPAAPIDLNLVNLRDALAHGRVSAGPRDNEYRIVKFSKPSKGDDSVTVDYSDVMSEAWFVDNKGRVRAAIAIVGETLNDSSRGSKLKVGRR